MMKIVLVNYIFIAVIFAKLKIQQYPQASEDRYKLDKDEIQYSLANYGKIPYGAKATAPLIQSFPLNGCSEISIPQYYKQQVPFILIERGDCHFTTKSLNAQKANAKLAIIMDNNPMDKLENIVLGDDGFGDNVLIPTIFISEMDGKKLLSLLQTQIQGEEIIGEKVEEENIDKQNLLIMSMAYQVAQTDRVDLKFFINPPLQSNFELLNGFFKHYKEALSELEKKKKLVFTPVYEISSCQNCLDSNINCIRNGRYCARDMDGDKAGTGGDVIEEYLRELCIKSELGTMAWYAYLQYTRQVCHQIHFLKDCASNYNFEDSQRTKIEKCMWNKGDKTTDNYIPILDDQLEIIKYANIQYYPSVTINNIKYRGSIQGRDVMEDVCATFQNTSPYCKRLIQNFYNEVNHTDIDDGPNIKIIILVVVIALVLFFLFMMFVYRKMVLKQTHQQVNTEVSQMFNQYIAFSENSKKKSQSAAGDGDYQL